MTDIWRRLVLLMVTTVLIGGCAWRPFADPGIGKTVSFAKLSGWETDSHAEAWPALLKNCQRRRTTAQWQSVCAAAEQETVVTNESARAFFEQHFRPHRVYGEKGRRKGLFTGYFEPLLSGSTRPTQAYRFPIYKRPDSLITVDLSALYPELKNKRIRGRLDGQRLVPYFDRAQIDSDDSPLTGNELLWVNDPYALFFLHIQGSGRVTMDDGRTLGVGYADQNGHPYVAIGRVLIEQDELQVEDVNMFSIRQWLIDHPDKAIDVLNANPRDVFFEQRDEPGDGPIGSMQVPLTTERSVAIDRRTIALGTPLWIETALPTASDTSADESTLDYQRLVFAQDTGGAIRSPVRVDIFFGHGKRAEYLAGNMKNEGKVYALLPVATP